MAAVVVLGARLERLAWASATAPWLVAASVAATMLSIAPPGWITRGSFDKLVRIRRTMGRRSPERRVRGTLSRSIRRT